MTYKYVLKYSKGKREKVSVEAWPRSRALALPNERNRPSFVIGSLRGTRVSMVRFNIKELAQKYGAKRKGSGLRIDFPAESVEAVADAYRAGLMVAALSKDATDQQAERIASYVMTCTAEEVWFWTSKYLNILGREESPETVVRALAVLAR